LKHSLKVGQKRKRLDRDSTTPSGDEHSVGSGGDPTLNGKKKKVRTTFTGRQIFELEKMFENRKYLSSSERADMAKLLNVTEQQVKIWFQNRRTKWKKQENISNAEAAELMKAKKENQLSSSLKVGKPSDNNNISGNGGGAASPNVTENGLNALLGKLSPTTSPLSSSPLPPPSIAAAAVAIPPLMPSDDSPPPPRNQTLVGILQQQIQSNHEALSSPPLNAAGESSGKAEEKVKGEEVEGVRRRRAQAPSSPPPLTSLLDSETGKLLTVQDGGQAAAAPAAKKSMLEEAVERMKAATTEGVQSPEAGTEEQ